MQPQQNKRKCRKTTNEAIPSQENQTTKETIRTRKGEKAEPTQEDSWGNAEKEPRETKQEDQEPDTMGRLIEEWVDAEAEHWRKTTSPREDKKQQNTTQNNRNSSTNRSDRRGGRTRKMPNATVHSGTER